MVSPESPAADTRYIVSKKVSSLSSAGVSINEGSLENSISTGAVGLDLVPLNGKDHWVSVLSSTNVSIAYRR